MMEVESYDSVLFGILQKEGEVLPFLDSILGFLYRRTDFFHITKTDDRIGFPPTFAKKLLFNIFSKYERQAQKEAEKIEEMKRTTKAEKASEWDSGASPQDSTSSPAGGDMFGVTSLEQDSSSCRKAVCHQQYLQEKTWFEDPYLKPQGVPVPCDQSDLEAYQHLIWENPPNMFINKYGMTVSEMAALCGQGRNGLLMSSHIEWLLNKANKKSTDSLCICIPTMTREYMKEIYLSKTSISRIFFVINVEKDIDGNVTFASSESPGNHWVLAVAELDQECIFYCDTLGCSIPSTLLGTLLSFIETLNVSIKKYILIPFHFPYATNNYCHSCSHKCKNYPILSCDNLCGIVAVIIAVASALDVNFFGAFTEKYFGVKTTFLHEPTSYEKHVRRILISWFIKDDVFVFPLKRHGHVANDHNYITQNVSLKEKADTLAMEEPNNLSNDELTREDSQSSKSFLVSKSSSKSPQLPNDNSSDLLNVILLGESSQSSSVPTNPVSSSDRQDCSLNVQEEFECPVCHRIYSNKNNLKVHIRRKHSPEMGENDKRKCSNKQDCTSKARGSFQCPTCLRLYTTKKTLTFHEKRKHPGVYRYTAPKGTCIFCKLCDFRAGRIKDLVSHYTECHNQKLEIKTYSFDNESQFYEWKKEKEMESSTRFSLVTGFQKRKDDSVHTKYMYCNRSGFKSVIPNRQRNRKSKKIDNKCTAFMTIKINSTDGSVSVECCLDHICHDS